jgi:hypothetical protein
MLSFFFCCKSRRKQSESILMDGDASTNGSTSTVNNTPERSITFSIGMWSMGSSLKIEKVYRTTEQLIVVSRISSYSSLGGSATTTISDSIKVKLNKELPTVHYVINGKSGYKFGEDYNSIDSEDDISELLKNADCIYGNNQEAPALSMKQ